MVAALAPDDPAERSRFLLSSLTGTDTGSFPSLHRPIESVHGQLSKQAEPFVNLKLYNDSTRVDGWLRDHGRDHATTGFIGLRTRSRDLSVVIDLPTGRIIAIADLRPWGD